MRKLKPAAIEYTAHPYGNHIIMVDNHKLFMSMYRKLTGAEAVPLINGCDGICQQLNQDGGMPMFMVGWFEPHKYSTLAHECSHAAFGILGSAGVHLEHGNNEAHAYLMGDMIDVFLGVRK